MPDDEHTIEYSVVVTGDKFDHEAFQSWLDALNGVRVESRQESNSPYTVPPANDVLTVVDAVFEKHGAVTTKRDVQKALKLLFYEEQPNGD